MSDLIVSTWNGSPPDTWRSITVGDKSFAVVSEASNQGSYVYVHVRTLAEALNATAKAIRVEGAKHPEGSWNRPGERLSRDKLPPESYLSLNAAEAIRERLNRSAESQAWVSMKAAWGRATDVCLQAPETTLSASDALKSEADALWRRLAEIEKAMDEVKARDTADAERKRAAEDPDAVLDVGVQDFDGTPITTFVWHARKWCLLADLAKALAPTNTAVRARFFEADVPPNACASLPRRRTLELRAVLGEHRPIPSEAREMALVAFDAVEQHVQAAITRTSHLSGGVDAERGRRFLAWWKGEEMPAAPVEKVEPVAAPVEKAEPVAAPVVPVESATPVQTPAGATSVLYPSTPYGISRVRSVTYQAKPLLVILMDGRVWIRSRDLGAVLGAESKSIRDWMGRTPKYLTDYRTIFGEGWLYIQQNLPPNYVETARRHRISFLSANGVQHLCSLVKTHEAKRFSAWWSDQAEALENGREASNPAQEPAVTTPAEPLPDLTDVVSRVYGKHHVTTLRWKGEPAVVGRHATRAIGYHGDPLSGSANMDRIFLSADTAKVLLAPSNGSPVSIFTEKTLTRLATRKGNYQEAATKFLEWWRGGFGMVGQTIPQTAPTPPITDPLVNAICTRSGVTMVRVSALASGLNVSEKTIRGHIATILADGGLKSAGTDGDYLDATAAHAVLLEHGGSVARRFGNALARAFRVYEDGE